MAKEKPESGVCVIKNVSSTPQFVPFDGETITMFPNGTFEFSSDKFDAVNETLKSFENRVIFIQIQ